MKRTNVLKYEIFGSVSGWPAEVAISRNEKSGDWTLYFRYTDPEARYTENVSVGDASGIESVLDERGATALEFAEALRRAAGSLSNTAHKANLAALADELYGLAEE